MRAVIVARAGTHQEVWAEAIASGLTRHGVAVERCADAERAPRRDLAVCWGWRKGEELRRRGHEVLVLERGYLGDRQAWTSLAWNGLNGRGDFCLPANPDPVRAEHHFGHLLKPWRGRGKVVAIMGQVQGDASLQGRSLGPWYRDAAQKAAAAYSLPVVFRQHPVAAQRGQPRPGGLPVEGGALEALLQRAHVVVIWNSNSGVDAVLAGVPVVAGDAGAMCWPVAGRSIGERWTPDRSAWFARLAWCQWRLEEMADGSAWERMRQGCRAMT